MMGESKMAAAVTSQEAIEEALRLRGFPSDYVVVASEAVYRLMELLLEAALACRGDNANIYDVAEIYQGYVEAVSDAVNDSQLLGLMRWIKQQAERKIALEEAKG